MTCRMSVSLDVPSCMVSGQSIETFDHSHWLTLLHCSISNYFGGKQFTMYTTRSAADLNMREPCSIQMRTLRPFFLTLSCPCMSVAEDIGAGECPEEPEKLLLKMWGPNFVEILFGRTVYYFIDKNSIWTPGCSQGIKTPLTWHRNKKTHTHKIKKTKQNELKLKSVLQVIC